MRESDREERALMRGVIEEVNMEALEVNMVEVGVNTEEAGVNMEGLEVNMVVVERAVPSLQVQFSPGLSSTRECWLRENERGENIRDWCQWGEHPAEESSDPSLSQRQSLIVICPAT